MVIKEKKKKKKAAIIHMTRKVLISIYCHACRGKQAAYGTRVKWAAGRKTILFLGFFLTFTPLVCATVQQANSLFQVGCTMWLSESKTKEQCKSFGPHKTLVVVWGMGRKSFLEWDGSQEIRREYIVKYQC